jgi:hypothetical protein
LRLNLCKKILSIGSDFCPASSFKPTPRNNHSPAMLTQLSTLKTRLGLAEADTSQDPLLLGLITACSAHFEQECRRGLSRAVNLTEEFSADLREICPATYPIETVSKFELKTSETGGWLEQSGVSFVLRFGCIVSLATPLGAAEQLARVTYTGGYVLPGTLPAPGQESLPADLEQAVLEQVAAWFLNRDKVGLLRNWPTNGTFQVLSQLPVLPWVRQVLNTHQRWSF